MCCNSDNLLNVRKTKVASVTAANKAKVRVRSEGDVLMQYSGPNSSRKVLLQNVLHVPDITANLVSVSAITKQGGTVTYEGSKCQVFDKQGVVIIEGNLALLKTVK